MAKLPLTTRTGKKSRTRGEDSGRTRPWHHSVERRQRDQKRALLPPPGPSNIIVRTANPLPAPKSVESQ